jgi:hypothetical protein
MKKQITIPGFIHTVLPKSWEFGSANVIDGVKYDFWVHESLSSEYTLVCPYLMTFDVPEKFDPVEGFVAGLQAEKKKLMADHQNALTQIDRQISQLLAITNGSAA